MKFSIVHSIAAAGFVAATLCPVVVPAAENIKLKPVGTEFIDEKGGSLKFPEGVACSRQMNIVVSDTGNGRLVRYSLQGDLLRPGGEIKLPQVSYPTKVAFNSKEQIFVLDTKLRKIARINPEGTFGGYVETGDPSQVPKSFAVDTGDSLYILDIHGGKVVVADPSGKKVSEIPFPPAAGFVSDIAVDPKGRILLLDNVNMMIFTTTSETKGFKPLTGSLREYLEFASDITTDSQGRIYVTDQNGGAVIILGPDGSFQGRQLSFGRKAGLLYYPAEACVSEAGDFVIADRGNSRIQLLKIMK